MNTNLQPIQLSVSQDNWRLFLTRKADPAFLAFEKKVFRRDKQQCQYCGFQASKNMEVVNLDGNYLNNRMRNLVTACPFCTQCFFLEAVGKGDFWGGVLIYLPEFSQGDLNSMCHVIFNSIVFSNGLSSSAKNIYRDLKLRSQIIEKNIGSGFSNPALYGQVVIDGVTEKKQNLHDIFSEKIRLLPAIKRVSKLIHDWSDDAVEAMIF